MATSYLLRETKDSEMAPIYFRIRSKVSGLNIKQSSHISVPIKKWNLDKNGKAYQNFITSEEWGPKIALLEEMKRQIECAVDLNPKITANEVAKIIDDVYYHKERAAEQEKKEAKKKAAEEAKKVTFNKFLELYLEQLKSGARQTDKGTNYDASSIKSVKGCVSQIKYYQKDKKLRLDFEDIDMPFYYAFTAYLKEKNYSVNTIGKHIATLKSIMRVAVSEVHTGNMKWSNKKFKATRSEVDTIYLTEEDLAAIRKVDLSKMSPVYDEVRDIFLLGVNLAQRVSDYNSLTRDMIETRVKRTIVDEPDPEDKTKTVARIVEKEIVIAKVLQMKTNKRVTIPCRPEAVSILKKYNFQLPHHPEQVINKYIKEIAKLANLTEKIQIISTRGGVENREMFEKWELVTTHTARRTGATLMYLAGMDCFDIMKVTGHESPQMLKKYIKADELEVVEKLTDNYNYFD